MRSEHSNESQVQLNLPLTIYPIGETNPRRRTAESSEADFGGVPYPTSDSVVRSEHPEPPSFAEYLIYLFLAKKERDNLLGDLREEFLEVYVRFGKGKAEIWFYKQVFASILPLARRARRALLKWGLLALAGEWVRKHIS